MSELKGLNSMKARYNFDRMTNWGITEKQFETTTADKVNVRGKNRQEYADPLVRIREDKLRSLKRALYNSYQSAVIIFDKDDREYHFRCLINHDKLKVDYQDKILSIPFREIPLQLEREEGTLAERMVDTGTPGEFLDENGNYVIDDQGNYVFYRVKAGDTFKWVSGNEGFMPDSYWIITLQYSEETAYFRGEIRKADDEIEIIPIQEDGSEGEPVLYRGWTTGPNEDQAIWNVKKGVIWNDMYYTKILYITKDEQTEAFFKRFDRVRINGQTWEVQGYNDNYGTTSKKSTGGLIRVALKETYTSTNQMIQEMSQTEEEYGDNIIGPSEVYAYDTVRYYVPNGTASWTVAAGAPITIISQDEKEIKFTVNKIRRETQIILWYGDRLLRVPAKPFN